MLPPRVNPGLPAPPIDATRRRLAMGMAVGACLAAWPVSGRARTESFRLRMSRPLMGTQVDIAVQGDDRAALEAAQRAAFARMAALAGMMSHYEITSRVSAINLAAGLLPVAIEPEMMQVLSMAQRVSRRTGGAFDVTIGSVGRWHFDAKNPRMPTPGYIASHLPHVDWRNLVLDEHAGTAYLAQRGMRVDLGGIAKLYILQAGLDTLRARGVASALINGGGDVVAMSAGAVRPWRVGVRDPRRPGTLLTTLDVREGFVASSGDYERYFERAGRRYHHVLDPRTGYPTQGPHGVTLVGPDLASVNGLATAAMVMRPTEQRELIRETRGVEALVAGRDGMLWTTPGMRTRLAA